MAAPRSEYEAEPANTPPPRNRWSTLPIEGFEPALISLPESSASGPVLVVTHGAGGTAEWHCQHWRALTGARGYILCLAGKRMIADRSIDSGYYYPDHKALQREIEAALKAFAGAFPEADLSALTYAGYSQGASMGALALAALEPSFTRAILIEGGFAEWNLVQARNYRTRGGERVLFVCGRRACFDLAEQSARWLRQKGVQAECVLAEGGGHTPAGSVARRTLERLPWLWAEDPRWAPPIDAQSDDSGRR